MEKRGKEFKFVDAILFNLAEYKLQISISLFSFVHSLSIVEYFSLLHVQVTGTAL